MRSDAAFPRRDDQQDPEPVKEPAVVEAAPFALSVFEEAVDAVVAFRDDGRYVYANTAAARLYGEPDILSRRVGDFAAEPHSGELDENWETLRSRGVVNGETVIRPADGHLKRIRYRVTATTSPDLYLAMVSVAERAGPRKPGQEGSRAELFHSVFEHAPEALLLADDRRRYLYGNRMARSFLGESRETLVGKRIDDLAAPGMRGQLEQLWATFLAGGTLNGIFPIALTNGLKRNILFRATASVRPGRHLISFQVARPERSASGLALGASGPAEPLTFREREILTLLARGSSAKEIAESASLSVGTVLTHIRNAMKKLGARTRSQVIALAIGLRQIDP